tara:strand:+ start:311 stop:631 length:321 start_codon:yes stop_codon:yes gene_type:complete
MIYCFDIDGTICTTDCHYEDAEPFVEVIKKINKLYEDGHFISMCTSRGDRSGKDWTELTEKQLSKWNVKFNELRMVKPGADVYVDDKCVNIKDWCLENNLKYGVKK